MDRSGSRSAKEKSRCRYEIFTHSGTKNYLTRCVAVTERQAIVMDPALRTLANRGQLQSTPI
jgi:hypothetical protein